MNDKLQRALLARRAGNVQRYHTWTLQRAENVAQHSFNAVNLLMILTDGQVSQRLLMAVISHDMGEWITGDIPSPAKKAIGTGRQALDDMELGGILQIHPYLDQSLTPYESRLLKLVDNIDGLMKCLEERRLGNRGIKEIYENYLSYLKATGPHGPTADELIEAIEEEYREYDH